ncbi:hypothetical protein Hamer_G017290, partial [Homarus americanus]
MESILREEMISHKKKYGLFSYKQFGFISGRTKVADHGYHMYTTIKKTTVEKDRGVVIDDKLTFSDHLTEKINKANKIKNFCSSRCTYIQGSVHC